MSFVKIAELLKSNQWFFTIPSKVVISLCLRFQKGKRMKSLQSHWQPHLNGQSVLKSQSSELVFHRAPSRNSQWCSKWNAFSISFLCSSAETRTGLGMVTSSTEEWNYYLLGTVHFVERTKIQSHKSYRFLTLWYKWTVQILCCKPNISVSLLNWRWKKKTNFSRL